MRNLTYLVPEADAGKTVGRVAPRRFRLGTHAFRRLKALGAVRVNGAAVHAGYVLRAGDVLEVVLENGAEIAPASSAGCGIAYADADMLVVIKPAPLATLPGRSGDETLRERLAAALGEDEATFRYHPVNRLDKGTSGLLVIARHAHAQHLLAEQLHTNAFAREYLAVTEGAPMATEGVIDAPIARLGTGARRGVREDGRRAVTHYRVEREANGRSLVRLRLETGRTHQIRVHLAYLGSPIVGDYLYGQEEPSLAGRFALHSARLACRQPITGAQIECEAPLPEELQALMT